MESDQEQVELPAAPDPVYAEESDDEQRVVIMVEGERADAEVEIGGDADSEEENPVDADESD